MEDPPGRRPAGEFGAAEAGSLASRWAAYRPAAPAGEPPVGLAVRPAERLDCASVAAIEASRDGSDIEGARDRCEAQLADPDPLLLVATVRGRVVGFARAGCLRRPVGATADAVPDGWYLLGVVVIDAWRRRGIGRALTRARLAWIADRADVAFYFANARNRASIDLHAELGFVELSRRFSAPGIAFEGGRGILCRLALR